MAIPGFRGLGPGRVLKQTVKEYTDDDMLTYAAALAYQVLFSIFPFLLFLVALLGVLRVPQFFDWLLQQARTFLPQTAMEQVEQVVRNIRDSTSGGLLSVGIILAIWSASAGIRMTMHALNVAYDVEEARPAWKRYPLSLLYTLGLGIIIIAAVALMSIGQSIVDSFAGGALASVWNWIRWPVITVLLMLSVAVIYYVAPDVKQRFRFITPGAVLAVVVWIAASLGFSYYVSNFANYDATYGSLGAVIILLLYFYISAAVLLFGAEMNAVIEHNAPSGKEPGAKNMNKHEDEQHTKEVGTWMTG